MFIVLYKQDIATSMACLYLLQGGPFYESHEFSMLFIRHLLNILMNANIVEASLVRSKNGYVVIYTPTTNYSDHPNSLEHMSFLCSFQLTKTFIPSNNSNLKAPPSTCFPCIKCSNP